MVAIAAFLVAFMRNNLMGFISPTSTMNTLTTTLMAAKKAKGMSFADLEAAMGLDEVWIASLFYGQAAASKEEAEKLAELLSLDSATTSSLQEFPT